MPSIAIFVTGQGSVPVGAGQFALAGVVLHNGGDPNGFEAVLNYSDNASQKQAVIEQAAINTLATIGVVVAGSDKRTVFGGPNN